MPGKKDKEFWQINTERLAAQLQEFARGYRKEEDFKMRAEPLIKRAFEALGVDVEDVQYEKEIRFTGYRSKRGSADVVYGLLLIEYKAPGKLASAQNVADTREQLIRYMTGEAERLGKKEEALEKMVGVSLDGEQILFLRFTRSARALSLPVPIPRAEQERLFPVSGAAPGFQVLGPYPIDGASLTNFLVFARAAGRRPLTAQDLARAFGPGAPVACRAVPEFYSAVARSIRRSGPSKVRTFFNEWDRIFGVVYGQELEKAEKAVEETAKLYEMPGGTSLKPLLFAIHSYLAFLMKLIAVELLALQRDASVRAFAADLPSLNDAALQERLTHLENGHEFSHRGIHNFLEADFFGWYLDSWNPALAGAVRDILRALGDFEPATPVLEPEWTQDLLQKLYELIVPQDLRHDLGEYYTPSWLAGYLVDRAGYTGDPATRFLDPSCGSGTFLVQAIHRAVRHAEGRKNPDLQKTGEAILNNIMGFDLNPLAVLAARTNYLIAISRFIPHVRPISIPVYLCDSIVPPEEKGEDGDPRSKERQKLMYDNDIIVFSTTKQDYVFPLSMKDKERIDLFTDLVDEGLRGEIDPTAFARLLHKRLPLSGRDENRLVDVYTFIKQLADQEPSEDGLWAKYIKNAFAPTYVDQFDFVVGNPPWIRWGYLSDEYRKRTLPLWHGYGLFSLKGHETRLGGGEKDFSMLFTYVCADRYLKVGGVLGFVITEEVFKSKGAGEGFRRFTLPASETPLKVLTMENMVDLKPFHAANKTTIFTMKKGEATKYPVPVTEWRRKGVGRIPAEWPLSEVLSHSSRRDLQAIPVDPMKTNSSWQTATRSQHKELAHLKGKNPYPARLGARVEPYGVFWLKIKEVLPHGKIVIENMHDRGKRQIPKVETSIEPDLVFPAVSGGDITRFGITGHFFVLISQDPETREGYDKEWLSTKLPLTLGYLVGFRKVLVKRAAYQKYFHKDIRQKGRTVGKTATAPFWSMYNISNKSFSRYRVAWKRMASRMEAVVLSSLPTEIGPKKLISTDTTSFFVAKNREEAHYLCGILNSDVVDGYIRSFSSAGRGFGAPSVMQTLAIPKFDEKSKLHGTLSEMSQEAHEAVAKDRDISEIQDKINQAVRELWNIKS